MGPVSRAGLRDLLRGTEGLSDAGGQSREAPGNWSSEGAGPFLLPRQPSLGRGLLAATPGLPFPGPTLLPSSSSFSKREDVSQIDFTVGNGIIKRVVSIFIIAVIK